MDKRGSISDLVLVMTALFGALALLATFLYYNSSGIGIPNEISEMMSEVEFAQQYVIAEAQAIGWQVLVNYDPNFEDEIVKIAKERDVNVKSFGNFFAKLERKDFKFEMQDDGSYSLEMEGLFVHSNKGMNSIRREFNISIKFREGELQRDVSGF